MKRVLAVSVGVLLVMTWLLCAAALAQGTEYTLKDYMPQTVGSTWTMKTTGPQGERTVTYEVLAARDIEGRKTMPIVMNNAQGQVQSGTMEAVAVDAMTLFGSLSRPRNAEAGAEPSTSLYQPAASFPGKLRVGQSEERKLKMSRGGQEMDVTLKLQLAAVESVTVPKGTFADCLKLVYTTSFGERAMTRTVWYAKGVGMVKREQSGGAGQPARVAQLTDYKQMPSKELPIAGEVFAVEGCTAFLIPPSQATNAGSIPWVWYAPTLTGYPGPEERWMFERFTAAGLAIAGIDVGESYGSPAGRRLYTALYEELVSKRGLSARSCLLARSRGGLMLYNWAVEHPTSVACIAGIYPVCNLSSYPGLEKAAAVYGLTVDELVEKMPQHNPLDRVEPLAKAGVPIFHIQGDSDALVPLESNSAELQRRYRMFGGEMTVKVIEGGGHDMSPHWFQSQELVDFVIAHARE